MEVLDIETMSIACKGCLLKKPLKTLTLQPMITGNATKYAYKFNYWKTTENTEPAGVK